MAHKDYIVFCVVSVAIKDATEVAGRKLVEMIRSRRACDLRQVASSCGICVHTRREQKHEELSLEDRVGNEMSLP